MASALRRSRRSRKRTGHGRDIGELLDHLELDDVTVRGIHGGNAIWASVDQFGGGRLRGVVIVDQTPKMLNNPDWPYGFYGDNVVNARTGSAHKRYLMMGSAATAGQERRRSPLHTA
jgi:hypothetical protein